MPFLCRWSPKSNELPTPSALTNVRYALVKFKHTFMKLPPKRQSLIGWLQSRPRVGHNLNLLMSNMVLQGIKLAFLYNHSCHISAQRNIRNDLLCCDKNQMFWYRFQKLSTEFMLVNNINVHFDIWRENTNILCVWVINNTLYFEKFCFYLFWFQCNNCITRLLKWRWIVEIDSILYFVFVISFLSKTGLHA